MSDFLNELPEGVAIIDADVMERYLTDFRRKYTGRAMAVLRPRSTEEVVSCVRLCAKHGVSIVPQGGNTSYCAAATPDGSGSQVILSFERMNRIREIDRLNRSVTVEAGVILSSLQDAVASVGLECPLSLGAKGSCQIGGNISTNAGGMNVIGAGVTRDLVLGLEVVLSDGQVLDTLEPLRKDNSGYAVDQLFIGAEGTLGLITAATLRMRRLAEKSMTAFLACPCLESVPSMLDRVQAATGDGVRIFEYIGHDAMDRLLSTRSELRLPLERKSPHYLLVEVATGTSAMPLEHVFEALVGDFMEEGLLTDGAIAASDTQRLALMDLRESIPEGEVLSGGSVKHDVAVRPSRIADFIERASAIVLERGCGARLSVYGHVGDGNVHFNVLPAPDNPVVTKEWIETELSPSIYRLTREMGGTFSAEYGIGQAKLSLNAAYGNPVKSELMRRIKRGIDPQNRFNPGKVVARDA
ncbi:FAD-binding oxidoreductase [Rhizobium arsenicireducens]